MLARVSESFGSVLASQLYLEKYYCFEKIALLTDRCAGEFVSDDEVWRLLMMESEEEVT